MGLYFRSDFLLSLSLSLVASIYPSLSFIRVLFSLGDVESREIENKTRKNSSHFFFFLSFSVMPLSRSLVHLGLIQRVAC